MAVKRGLEPVICGRSRILILGTLPSDESLRMQQYYANPRNHFWTILSRVYEVDVPEEYADRLEFLLSRGLALWDVLRTARRRGSLDAEIRDEIPNDLESFLSQYPSIKAIGFNGRKAHQLFEKHIGWGQHLPTLEQPRVGVLPSSSPTPGRNVLPLNGKVERWRTFLLA